MSRLSFGKGLLAILLVGCDVILTCLQRGPILPF